MSVSWRTSSSEASPDPQNGEVELYEAQNEPYLLLGVERRRNLTVDLSHESQRCDTALRRRSHSMGWIGDEFPGITGANTAEKTAWKLLNPHSSDLTEEKSAMPPKSFLNLDNQVSRKRRVGKNVSLARKSDERRAEIEGIVSNQGRVGSSQKGWLLATASAPALGQPGKDLEQRHRLQESTSTGFEDINPVGTGHSDEEQSGRESVRSVAGENQFQPELGGEHFLHKPDLSIEQLGPPEKLSELQKTKIDDAEMKIGCSDESGSDRPLVSDENKNSSSAEELQYKTDWKEEASDGYARFIGDRSSNSDDKLMIQPLGIVSRIAIARTRFEWLNVLWLLLMAFFTPAAFGVLWFGAIPISIHPLTCKRVPSDLYYTAESSDGLTETGCKIGAMRKCVEGSFSDKAAWAFVVNPGTFVFFSFNLIIIFFGCLDEGSPWRPFTSYLPILAVGYIVQVMTAGISVIVRHSFKGLGLVTLAFSISVTLTGLRLMPYQLFDTNREHFMRIYWSFVRIMCLFMVFWLLMLSYIVANAHSEGAGQGFLTFGLSIVTFIFKKILLSMTDRFPLEMAMVISGLWLENLVDLFIILAYPTATQLGPTFAIIWLTRVGEDLAYLGFQFDIWFKFRVWIKGVLGFTKRKSEPIEDDIDPDDRGHSNIHPGYRRRQMRFLAWKLLSQLSSSIFYLVVIPALRFGQNKDFYPYSVNEVPVVFDGVTLDEAFGCFTHREFKASMIFAFLSMSTFFVSGYVVFWYMRKYHYDILHQLIDRSKELIVSQTYFGFVLTILVSNVLIAVSAVQFYNRLFYF